MYEMERGKTFIAIGDGDYVDLDQIVRVQRGETKAVITVRNNPMLITSSYTYDQVWSTIQKAMQT